eukprot:TRINITY_DN7660_c0_g1_i1.p1 TRINITY_DN7660_c0_g1~~TRINITY_DN7660_c0_g1_i1.p1  ORF type:complete len:530 (+),score=137.89 TRINITY_DN7660_c0_g1_i1:122-1711(+)
MPLHINIDLPNSKKTIGIPFKKNCTVQDLIDEIINRSSLQSGSGNFVLEFNNSELYAKDTIEDLNISDNSTLSFRSANIQASNAVVVPHTLSQTLSTYTQEIKQIDVIVLDLSGSMKADAFRGSKVKGELEMTRIETAQSYFQTFIDKFVALEVPVAVGLVCFGEKIELTFPITRNFDSFSTELGDVDANQGKTRLFEAIQRAAETIVEFKNSCASGNHGGFKLASEDKLSCRIFCLTDGEDNSGVDPYPIYQYLKNHNIILDSIPIGTSGSALARLTKATGGSCFIVQSSVEGVSLFEREAVLSVSVRADFNPFSVPINQRADLEAVQVDLSQPNKVERKENPQMKAPCISNASQINQKFSSSTGSAVARIAREYSAIQNETSGPIMQFSTFLNPDNIHIWKVIYKGQANSAYEGGHWIISVVFPSDYPFKPPKVRFETKIYHCNISNDGALCLDVLKDHWSPALSIGNILGSIDSLLFSPNPDDPLDAVKAGVYRDNRNNYWENVKAWVRVHASTSLEELKQQNDLQ